jgi:hypothetical protein
MSKLKNKENKMGIIDELGKLIVEAPEDEDTTDELDTEEEAPKVGDVGDLLKHIESLQAIVQDIDGRVDVQSEDDPAFRAEVSIRKAIGALQALSDKLYKKTK